MAARRIAKSSINWADLADRVPAHQKVQFINFKVKSDAYMRAVLANPETPPKINWDHYKKLIPIAGLVDTFQKKYEALKVPYPADNVSSQIDEQIMQMKAEVDAYKKGSEERIAQYKKEIDYIGSLLPYNQMTMEDYRDAYPDLALDPINRPTMWPHTPEEQAGYVPKDGVKEEAH